MRTNFGTRTAVGAAARCSFDPIGLALSCTCNVYVSNDMTPKSTNVQPSETDTAERRASSKQSSLGPSSFATGFGGSRSLHNTRPLSELVASARGIAFELGD